MKTKNELLEKYDGPNQDTKREIIRYLWNNPDREHQPREIFEAISSDCRADSADTVANNLSQLTEEDSIHQETRSFYRWAGIGRRRPNRRLGEVRFSMKQWLRSLDLSLGTLAVTFIVWIIGILSALLSLVILFTPINLIFGLGFRSLFIIAGTLTICGSAAVMMWLPLYFVDVKTSKWDD